MDVRQFNTGENWAAKARVVPLHAPTASLWSAMLAALLCSAVCARNSDEGSAQSRQSATESTAEASEIAARAAASAMARPGEDIDQMAAGAYDAVARDLLLRIERIEQEHGHLARELEGPLFELGKLYVSADQCQNAIPILRQAILLSQRLDGVMNTKQLPLHEPLLECFVARDRVRDLEGAQEQMLLVYENTYGKDDVRMLPALEHAGAWYEQAGEYESARDVDSRALKLARKAGGDPNPLMVGPLRAMARTYRYKCSSSLKRCARPRSVSGSNCICNR